MTTPTTPVYPSREVLHLIDLDLDVVRTRQQVIYTITCSGVPADADALWSRPAPVYLHRYIEGRTRGFPYLREDEERDLCPACKSHAELEILARLNI